MSFESLKEMGIKRVELAALPDEFVAEVVGWQVKKDSADRECLYLRLRLEDGGEFTQKYTPMHFRDLAESFLALGVKHVKETEGRKFRFKRKMQPIGYDRWFPVGVEG